MVTTILGLLVVLTAVCIVLGVAARMLVIRLQSRHPQDVTQPRPGRATSLSRPVAESIAPFPVPPEATLLRTESVPISQAGNPAPMLRTGTITGTAYWYRAPLSYPDVADWYRERLPAEGWQEEAGHGQLRVFRRERTLLWLADGEDAALWQRLTNPLATSRSATPPRNVGDAVPNFTVLMY